MKLYKPLYSNKNIKKNRKRIGNEIFNSKKHKWDKENNEFYNKICSKQTICILIEDKKDNIFGGYVHSKIDEDEWNIDRNTFIFSSKREGIINPKKFELKKDYNYGFCIGNNNSDILFSFGGKEWLFGWFRSYNDIVVFKNNSDKSNCCQQYAFDYNGKEHCLCGNDTFEIKKIIVFETN